MDRMSAETKSAFMEVRDILQHSEIFKANDRIHDRILWVKYKALGEHVKKITDYDRSAASFSRVYFWKNFLKCLIFFSDNYYLLGEHIYDIGCGAASASIAIAQLVKRKEKRKIAVYLIDKSPIQLKIAKSFMERLSFSVDTSKKSLFDWDYIRGDGIVVFSYFVCEQKKCFIEELYENKDKFRSGFVIIDYKKNIELIEHSFRLHNDSHIRVKYYNVIVPTEISNIIGEKEVQVYGCYYKP